MARAEFPPAIGFTGLGEESCEVQNFADAVVRQFIEDLSYGLLHFHGGLIIFALPIDGKPFAVANVSRVI